MIEWPIGKDVDESGRGLIWRNIPGFASRDWEKLEKILGAPGVLVENQTGYAPHTSQKLYRLCELARSIHVTYRKHSADQNNVQTSQFNPGSVVCTVHSTLM
jgi:hypothetical protein